MSFESRIFQALETELHRSLAFNYSVERRFDESGSPATFLTVMLRNDSSVTLRDLRGAISPASGAVFKKVSFRIRSLGPQQETEIARIQARIPATFASAPMATVDFSSDADLSFRFFESGQALTYVAIPSAVTVQPDVRHDRKTMRSSIPLPAGIPLSPMRDVS